MTRAAPVVSIPAHASAAASAPWIGPLALTALAYAAAGLLALPLAVPPHQAPLVGLAAGVALASVLVHGWRMLGGVAAGALALQLAIGASRGEPAALLVALSIALAAALQAAAGAALVRRFVDRPLTLAAPRDIAAFFACCAASSVVGATLASLALRSAAMVAPADGAASWAAWWIGDLAGLLVATPMVLTLIGRPRAEWAPRRLAVGLTLALAMLILALAVEETTRRTGAQSTAWMVAAIGVACAGALAALLLATTARARGLERALGERTEALRAEVAGREVAENALHASEARFRNVLDTVPIGVVYTDLAGRVLQSNPHYCELTGYDEGELARLDPAALTHPEDFANDQLLTAQLVAGEIPMYRRHKRCLNRAGEIVWVRSTVSLLRDAEQAPWRLVGVVEDITEHLRLEEAERAREAAELSNRAKSDFLSRMSHELRTPLNAMLGFAQLLEIDRRNPLTAGQRPWVAQIQQAGWHLLEMINDVLDLSRIDSGNLRLQTTTLELGELVDATTALVASDAAARGIRISQQLAPEASAVLGDATRVKQILTNLLSNAVKYNIDNGRVHVASRIAAPDVVEISVTDTGMGMTPEQMDELFRPFNRLGRERTALQGTGIGLVISRRLAELMGGSIRVKSVPGEGSSFILKLPKAIDPDTMPSSLDDLAALPADYHRRMVLYVEDNETNIEVMRGILAQRAQVQMEIAVSGLGGLGAIRERAPHLILLDMHLPDMSGLELLRHLKADPATSSIPVIVVSADATAQQVDAALDAGAVRYLTKPVGVNELLAAVDELLERMDTGFS